MAAVTVSSWLNLRRIRIHALLLAVCLWSVYAIDMSTSGLRDRAGLIKGTDFLQFYVIGKLGISGKADSLYNVAALSDQIHEFVPAAQGIVYAPLYGPQIMLLFSPLARLSYFPALFLWSLLNFAIYFGCVYLLWKRCRELSNYRWPVLICSVAFPGFFHLIAWGQTSGIALLCFTGAFLALVSGKRFVAGILIGCLIFKPQLGLASAAVFLLARQWKIVFGASLSAAAQAGLGWLVYGTQIMRNYLHAVLHASEILPLLDPRPYQMHSLWHFWSLLIPFHMAALLLYVASAAMVIAWTIHCWKRALPLPVRFAALLIATVLASPHLAVYDLVILAPAFLWLADWYLTNSADIDLQGLPLLVYLCYPLFLIGPLARYTHLQFSVPVLVALLWTINAATLNTTWRIQPNLTSSS